MSKISTVAFIAYEQGRSTWHEVKYGNCKKINPYPKGSEPWKKWNEGWWSMVEEAQHDKNNNT